MPLKSLTFISLFLICSCGALFYPYIGIYGYLADYCVGSSGQWWEATFSRLGLRYSFTLAAATGIGIILQNKKLRWEGSLLQKQELLLLLFLAFIWFSVAIGDTHLGLYKTVDHPAIKFTKAVIFILMMTHVITDKSKIDGLFWVLIIISLILGLQAWDMPRRAFISGRLEGIGGADFAESNFFAAFMASMLPIIGTQLLKTKNWPGKAVCAVSAAFTANAIVLCRSRGAFLGVAVGGIAALVFAPKKNRMKILLLLILGIIGGIRLADPQFIERIATIHQNAEERDESAESRLRIWRAGLEMIKDRPLGIGVGNWYQNIGDYLPEYAGKDSHNTYIKCCAELGVQGITVFGLIILGSCLQLKRLRNSVRGLPPEIRNDFNQFSFGLFVSISIILTCGLTITMIYIEILWILLMLPMCLERALQNTLADHKHALSGQ